MGRLVIQWFRQSPQREEPFAPVGTAAHDPLHRIEEADPEALCSLGSRYASGKDAPLDYEAAMKCYRLAAEKKFAKAQYHLGEMYASGRGVERDMNRALEWWRLASEGGDPAAQLRLADHLEPGEEADRWIMKAAEAGDTEAMFRLGSTLGAKGMPWLSVAASQGHVKAQYLLGIAFDQGVWVERDTEQALAWWLQAAEKNSVEARRMLGMRHFHGKSVPQDFRKAYYWFNLAAAGGDEESQMWRDCVLSRLAPEEVAEIQGKVREDLQGTDH